MDALVTSLATGIEGICTSALTGVGAIAPKALPIFGAGVIITVVMKIVKKFA